VVEAGMIPLAIGDLFVSLHWQSFLIHVQCPVTGLMMINHRRRIVERINFGNPFSDIRQLRVKAPGLLREVKILK
jgi:hypothetical protein